MTVHLKNCKCGGHPIVNYGSHYGVLDCFVETVSIDCSDCDNSTGPVSWMRTLEYLLEMAYNSWNKPK